MSATISAPRLSSFRGTSLSTKSHRARNGVQPSSSSRLATTMLMGYPKKVLLLGGTRFIGLYLARQLIAEGHDVTLLTRGNKPIDVMIPDDEEEPGIYAKFRDNIKHIRADRTDAAGLKAALSRTNFDVLYDINGREAMDAEMILDAMPYLQRYIFCSSAGVYKKSEEMPHLETDEGDPKSRHKGKLDTEEFLRRKGVAWTSVRPVYIYGPLNYNPVEEWFFHRVAAGRPIPIPGSGMQITQMGHVKDLANFFTLCVDNDRTEGQIYNVSGSKYVTFNGLALACAAAAGKEEATLVHYDPNDFDFGKKKAFPFRNVHFFASIEKAEKDLGWTPQFSLRSGLKDSYRKDFGRGNFRKAADFSTDDMVLEKAGIYTRA